MFLPARIPQIILFTLAILYCSEAMCEEPEHKLVELNYHYCPLDNALRGGIWNKGPFKKFGPNPSLCEKEEWELVSRLRFKELATKYYEVDWTKEINFWSENEHNSEHK